MHNRKPLAALAVILLFSAGTLTAVNYRPAGVDMTQAARDFLAGLSAEQRAEATIRFDDAARLDWHFIPKDKRKGLQIKHMDSQQRKLAHTLLSSAVSQLGYDKAKTIMSLEAILHELEKNKQGAPLRDPERYYFTVFGQPSEADRWGLSVEGHHLSLNFVVDGGKIASVTPAFYGANPADVRGDYKVGAEKGTRVLHAEEDRGFALLKSLSSEQRAKAVIAEKSPPDIRGAAQPQPPQSEPEGVPASELSDEQVKTLWSLLEAYTDNMTPEIGQKRLAEVRDAGIKKVYFAWAGPDKPGIGHYYRVQGPTFLIEFCNNQPDGAGNPANHIHSVWRQMDGDFGISK
ncbi:MAG TPA: DUF3500 domain-containing protein [Pirellulales bacterium]|nr:DUF3500 domain-containing protein [Pirellulales bacterium]